jgi:hypothetical protein
MKKILLTSQGIQPEIKRSFLDMFDKPSPEIEVAFVVMAAYSKETNPVWLEVYRE